MAEIINQTEQKSVPVEEGLKASYSETEGLKKVIEKLLPEGYFLVSDPRKYRIIRKFNGCEAINIAARATNAVGKVVYWAILLSGNKLKLKADLELREKYEIKPLKPVAV